MMYIESNEDIRDKESPKVHILFEKTMFLVHICCQHM